MCPWCGIVDTVPRWAMRNHRCEFCNIRSMVPTAEKEVENDETEKAA